jgi:hypothetical protein
MGQHFGGANRDRNDVHRQDIDLLRERPDERPAADPDPEADFFRRTVGEGDGSFPAGNDQGFVRPDFPELPGEKKRQEDDQNEGDSGQNQDGDKTHGNLPKECLRREPIIP